MSNGETVSRLPKLSHLDTILYEVDMLDFCYNRLLRGDWVVRKDYYLCIEGFLLHYRNLIQFFGNRHDLRAGKPREWSPRALSAAELASIQDGGPFDRYNGQISQYLSHCTKSRADRDRDWKHVRMYAEIRPLLENFRRLFPAQQIPSGVVALGAESVSTATTSRYDPGLIVPEGPNKVRD